MYAAHRSPSLIEFPTPIAMLVVNSDAYIRQLVKRSIPEHRRARVSLAFSDYLFSFTAATRPDVVLINLRAETPSAFTQLYQVCRRWPGARVIFLSPTDNIDLRAEAIQLGAYDLLPKSIDPDRLKWVLQGAFLKRRAGAEDTGHPAPGDVSTIGEPLGF